VEGGGRRGGVEIKAYIGVTTLCTLLVFLSVGFTTEGVAADALCHCHANFQGLYFSHKNFGRLAGSWRSWNIESLTVKGASLESLHKVEERRPIHE
jgi:hypothetical protein